MDDVVLNKVAAIERCVRRVREEHAGDDSVLERDLTKQDSIVLNLQRACETSIDLAMHLVRVANLGIPQDSREAFELLATHSGLDRPLADRLMRMVGFRNIAVHDYQKLNLDIVREIIAERLPELLEFTRWALTR
jgi:uncharacterized protein YutE (UPF0331/DUF86 family)